MTLGQQVLTEFRVAALARLIWVDDHKKRNAAFGDIWRTYRLAMDEIDRHPERENTVVFRTVNRMASHLRRAFLVQLELPL